MSLNATTLNGGITASDSYVRLASGTGAEVGKLLKVGKETMKVLDVSLSPTLRVARGQASSAAVAHTTGARAVLGLASDFPVADRSSEYHYVAAGALTVKEGLHTLKSGAASAMTLRDPLASEEGITMQITALDAQAYTLDYTAGFKATTTSSDRLTWGGGIGDTAVIKVVNGIWNIVSLHGVSLG